MASGASVRIGVDVTQFRQGMAQAQQSAKTLNTQMKANEAQLKATGDKEQYLTQKAKLLKAELEAQKKIAENAGKALEAMRKEGVDPASSEYQKLAQQLAGATAAMYETQAAMNSLTASEERAGSGAGQLTQSLNSISRNVSFDTVIGGINKITGGLESAAAKAVNLGKSIFDNVLNSAKWADDVATMAQMYEVPLDTYLRMEALVESGMDTSVDAILGSMSKLKKGVGTDSKAVMDALTELGLVHRETDVYGNVWDVKDFENADELFWKAGQAIMAMGDAFDKEATAQAVFGKSWRELIPLFDTENGGFANAEEFNKALESMNVNTAEQVQDLAALNDAMSTLEHNFTVLKNDVLAALAPALTKAADALSGLLDSIMEYLDTPEGKQALQDMSDAVSGLFDDLGKIDPAEVVSGFREVFDAIVGGLQWMVKNKDTLTTILKTIVAGWGLAKLTGGALQVLQLVNGIKGLGGANGVKQLIEEIAANGGGGTSGVSKALETAAGAGGGGGDVVDTAAKASVWRTVRKVLTSTGAKVVGGSTIFLTALLTPAATETKEHEDAAVRMHHEEMEKQEKYYKAVEDILGAEKFKQIAGESAKELSDNHYEDRAAVELDELLEYFQETGVSAEDAAKQVETFGLMIGRIEENDWYAAAAIKAMADEATVAAAKLSNVSLHPERFAYGYTGYDSPTWYELNKYAIDSARMRSQQPQPKLGIRRVEREYANGLFSVPWDGYPAILHKGERVLTARENQQYTYNNYFGNVNLNNGLEIEALTESIDRRNRRQRSGYGS